MKQKYEFCKTNWGYEIRLLFMVLMKKNLKKTKAIFSIKIYLTQGFNLTKLENPC